jgi:ribosomal protein S18 acetylase RimI-like enzyme
MSGQDVRLRAATANDLELLTVFMRQLREDDAEEGAFDEPRCVPAMRRLIADPKLGRAWLIEVDAQSAGYAVLTLGYSIEFGGVAAFVDELFVAREFRGRGVGTKTLELIIIETGNLDVAILLLEVTNSNDRAKRLYRKAGFADRGHSLMTRRPG